MKKKQQITETNKAHFFQTLKRAALPLDQTGNEKSAGQTIADYSGKQTHSHTPANTSGKRGGKSR